MFEGIATFFETHLQRILFPERSRQLNNDFMFLISDSGQMFDNELFYEVWPMNRHVETPEEIEGKFNFVSYYKAAAVYKSFYEAIGAETWLKGLRYFLWEMQNKSANPKDLHRALQLSYDEDYPGTNLSIELLMETYENQAGYPMVNVSKVDGKLRLTQQRYPNGDEIYAIPINYATARNPNFDDTSSIFWMTEKEAEFEYDDDWIVMNIQSTGYYIMNYDDDLWSSITAQLIQNHSSIHYMNRIYLMSDYFQAAIVGHAKLSSFLKTLVYMKNERDADVWYKIEDSLFTLNDGFMGQWFYIDFKEYIRDLVAPSYLDLGYSSEDVVTRWACITGVETCLKIVFDSFLSLLNQTAAHDDIDISVYCLGIRSANETIFRQLWSLMLNSTDHEFSTRSFYGLSCVKDERLFQELLESSINESFHYNDDERHYLIHVSIPHDVLVVLQFIKENYQEIHRL